MPRKLKLNSLTSDKYAVQQLISEAIEYGDIVGELQYREKLEKLDKEISLIKNANETNASVALFFGGEPVLGSQGILASFAGNALENFQELINKAFASKENGSLGERGKIPLKANSNLMITQVAKGSFGFILDEVSDQIEITETALKHTVDYVLELINASAQPDDETFEKLIESLDKRVLQSLKDFFITLDKAHSTMRLVGDEQEYSLDSHWIHRARLRTEATEIDEDEDLVVLKVLGLLPEHCKFEAVTREGNIIYGSTTRLAAEQFRSELIGKEVRVNLLTKSIKPLHRPERTVYKLMEFLDKNL
ncbi:MULTISPECIES: hypothetical protein [Shewanella]|uniref:hypothetical protein n=1 Tax=Shewanella TaxID=22 RepID=UPI00002E2C2C|nr:MULTISPECIES: hypothetical protein [Shewanella]KPN76746.1 hypothetical protein AEA42_12150 [Shewanella sp. Sh95]MBW0298676.1 hypothetical protein [Shewanella xiamenensis]MDH1627688.1 hypothetical protein [Shewanella xiamenensis]MDV5246159.1 hypothetical protein [Shewanella xiamenensis]